ncbi:hypothetical protein C9374_010876 [Naegleria lovaniensis]|uniref:Guanylate cyclase domain-containing protein n=1 Tax=Naegleria lovaniensis TaxID=51637 RepID=A0AA88GD44_NAELO|nr:uncharacterized protein C9374_010876 [Naegleria lovaniensis]KAG2374306.1 hypothetical protein C9374_010876 [Naegleria lovaniensis]
MLTIFIIQTIVCIGSLLILFYSSGNQYVDNISTIREENVKRQIHSYFATGGYILKNVREVLFLDRFYYGNTIGNASKNAKRILSAFAPVQLGSIHSSCLFYANSKKQVVSIVMTPTVKEVIYTADDNFDAKISPYNMYYEPTNPREFIRNYDPTVDASYTTVISCCTFPKSKWTKIFINPLVPTTSLALVTKLDFEMVNETGVAVSEVISVGYDFFYLDMLLSSTVVENIDMQTRSIKIVLVERNGLLVSSSMKAQTYTGNTRFHMSTISAHFEKVSQRLMKHQMLSDLNFTSPIDYSNTRMVFYENGIRVSAESFTDGNGLDWIVIVSTVDHGFVKIIFTSSPVLLALSISLIILGTIVMIVISVWATRRILRVAHNMYQISRMEDHRVKNSKRKLIFELGLLQNASRAVQLVLDGFVKYIPKEIVKDIVHSKTGATLGMINIYTTTMFTDIEDFTNLSESIPISTLITILSHYFDIVTKAVEQNGGNVDKFIGDGTMSVFSMPTRIWQDHPSRACRAALESLSQIEDLKVISKREGWPRINIRVGINTGNAMIGNVGCQDRFDYTALGDSVNTSSRLEALNKRYQSSLLIGQTTYEEVKDEFVCFFVDTVKLKGKDLAIDIYTIETEWKHLNPQQRHVHDKLFEIRESMHHHKFEEMRNQIHELVTCVAEYEKDASKSNIRSNMNFLGCLIERSNHLIQSYQIHSKFASDFDYSLTLTEK